MFFALFIFTGCGTTYINGIPVQDKKDIETRSKIKVFLDNTATIKRELAMMKDYADIVKKEHMTYLNIKFNDSYFSEGKNYEIVRLNNWLADFENSVTPYAITNFNNKSLIDFNTKFIKARSVINATDGKGKDKISIDFRIEGRRLVSEKYEEIGELLRDIYLLAALNKTDEITELRNKYGSSRFIIDGDEILLNKRIVLIPLTNYFSFKRKMDELLDIYGYTIVDSKEKADEVIELDALYFAKGKELKAIQKNSLLLNSRAKGSSSVNLGSAVMSGASTGGANDGVSIALGLGMSLLGFIGGADNSEAYFFAPLIKKIHDGKEVAYVLDSIGSVSLLGFYANYNLKNLQEVKKKEKDQYHKKFVRKLSKFIEKGNTYNTKDKKIK
jgi:hypothetical protein